MSKDPSLLGRTIVGVRPLEEDELDLLVWGGEWCPAVVLTLDDGSLLVPSQDMEGKRPGCLFWFGPDGESFERVLPPPQERKRKK